jgi:hypothetical protein
MKALQRNSLRCVPVARGNLSRSRCPEIWTAPVATESHEVEITVAIVASQRVAHQSKTRTLKPEGSGTQVSYLQRTVPG